MATWWDSQLIGKDPDARKDWEQKEKGTTEDGMVGCHHQLSGHEFEQTPGDSEGQGSLACCSPWMQRVGHDLVTEQQQFCDYYIHKHKYHYDSTLENTKWTNFVD